MRAAGPEHDRDVMNTSSPREKAGKAEIRAAMRAAQSFRIFTP
jgi:hypothetical protein